IDRSSPTTVILAQLQPRSVSRLDSCANVMGSEGRVSLEGASGETIPFPLPATRPSPTIDCRNSRSGYSFCSFDGMDRQEVSRGSGASGWSRLPLGIGSCWYCPTPRPTSLLPPHPIHRSFHLKREMPLLEYSSTSLLVPVRSIPSSIPSQESLSSSVTFPHWHQEELMPTLPVCLPLTATSVRSMSGGSGDTATSPRPSAASSLEHNCSHGL
ncbi:hypothetical protein PENTCL1PPCAC_24825, partial [Pristionchus entomophagus]